MSRLLCYLLFVICSTPLNAATPLDSGESVLVYGDGLFDSACKNIAKEFKDTLKSNKVKWKVDGKKGEGYLWLKDNLEKEILKSKATRVILAMGSHDLWDFKKNQATLHSIDDMSNALKHIISTIKESGMSCAVLTNTMHAEGTNEQSKQRLSSGASIIKTLCQEMSVDCIDIYNAMDKHIAQSEPAKKGKGILTKDGVKLNKQGEALVSKMLAQHCSLTANTLSRKLVKGDIIVFSNGDKQNVLGLLKAQLGIDFADMGLMKPRVAQIADGQMFKDGNHKTSHILAQKPTIFFYSPGLIGIMEGDRGAKEFDNGSFKKGVIATIEDLKQNSIELFLMTPLLWVEYPSNNIEKDGKQYKRGLQWAQIIREVGEETGTPVIDVFQTCLDLVEQNQDISYKFAGTGTKQGNKIKYRYVDRKHGAAVLNKAIADVIHIKIDPETKAIGK